MSRMSRYLMSSFRLGECLRYSLRYSFSPVSGILSLRNSLSQEFSNSEFMIDGYKKLIAGSSTNEIWSSEQCLERCIQKMAL